MCTFLIKAARNLGVSENVYINKSKIITTDIPIEAYSNEADQDMFRPLANEFIAFVTPITSPQKSISKYYIKEFTVLHIFKISKKNLKQIINALRKYEFYNNVGVEVLRSFDSKEVSRHLKYKDILKFIENSYGYSKKIVLLDYSGSLSPDEKNRIFIEHIHDYGGVIYALEVWNISDEVLDKKISMGRGNQETLFAIGTVRKDKRNKILEYLDEKYSYKAIKEWNLTAEQIKKLFNAGKISDDLKIKLSLEKFLIPRGVASKVLMENKHKIEVEEIIRGLDRILDLKIFSKQEIKNKILDRVHSISPNLLLRVILSGILDPKDVRKILQIIPTAEIEEGLRLYGNKMISSGVLCDVLDVFSIDGKILYEFLCENQDRLSKKQIHKILSKIIAPYAELAKNIISL
ncbi:MAG: hypothetical protein ABIM30_00565 [candidate division WOR-3 bacterium]